MIIIKESLPKIKHVQINNEKRCVTVVFNDNTHEIVRCSPEDEFDPKIGLALAVCYHFYGSRNKFSKLLDNATVIQRKEPVVIEKEETSKKFKDILAEYQNYYRKNKNLINKETGIYGSLWKHWRSGVLPANSEKEMERVMKLSELLNLDFYQLWKSIREESAEKRRKK